MLTRVFAELRALAAVLFAAALLMMMTACGSPPDEALDAAERELLNAAFARECASETYQAAERLLDEARAASAAGEYDEARRKADAARLLVEQARQQAELNREECERRHRPVVAEVEPERPANLEPTDQVDEYELKTVFFPFDEATLTPEARQALDANADWLLRNTRVRIAIEGHTDEQGASDYNLALSQRRAQTVKQYLQRMGVEASRMRIVPFGEERLADPGGGDSAHAQNRRAEFERF